MPHQCLGCGKSFPEGSTDLLRGCPGCSGTRFFYTDEALGKEGLEEKRREAETDIRQLADQLSEEDIWSWRKRDEWVQFDAKKVNDALTLFSESRSQAVESEMARERPTVAEYVAAHESDVDAPPEAPAGTSDTPSTDATSPKKAPRPVAAELPKIPKDRKKPQRAAKRARPEAEVVQDTVSADVQEEAAAVDAAESVSVRVGEPGSYDINVKSLLEANPVVIERDGVYMIHLASAFESADKKRAKADD